MTDHEGAEILDARRALDWKADRDSEAKRSAKNSSIAGKSSALASSSWRLARYLVTLGMIA